MPVMTWAIWHLSNVADDRRQVENGNQLARAMIISVVPLLLDTRDDAQLDALDVINDSKAEFIPDSIRFQLGRLASKAPGDQKARVSERALTVMKNLFNDDDVQIYMNGPVVETIALLPAAASPAPFSPAVSVPPVTSPPTAPSEVPSASLHHSRYLNPVPTTNPGDDLLYGVIIASPRTEADATKITATATKNKLLAANAITPCWLKASSPSQYWAVVIAIGQTHAEAHRLRSVAVDAGYAGAYLNPVRAQVLHGLTCNEAPAT
jgi:hypothetical protein